MKTRYERRGDQTSTLWRKHRRAVKARKKLGNQATAMYLELDVELLRKMFAFLSVSAIAA